MKKLVYAAVFASLTFASQAAVTQVNSRAALAGDDFINWGQLGGVGTQVPNPSNVLTDDAFSATVSSATAGGMERRDQGNGWAGNFFSNEQLLWSRFDGPITISFTSAVMGAGFNIQRDNYGAFTGTLEAFNGVTSLGVVNVAGNGTADGDGSAVFLGLISGSADITSIRFTTDSDDFAINQVDLVNGVGAVPEVQTWASLAGVLLVGAEAFRRRQAAKA